MPAKSIEPLKKITVDLFLTDVEYLRENVENLSDEIREAVHFRVRELKNQDHIAEQEQLRGF